MIKIIKNNQNSIFNRSKYQIRKNGKINKHEEVDLQLYQFPLYIYPLKTPLFPQNSLVTKIHPSLH